MSQVRTHSLFFTLLLQAAALASGCGDDDSVEDAGTADAGASDAGAASARDGQVGAEDARVPVVDAGGVDAGAVDAGASVPDAGSAADGGQQGGHAAGQLCGGFAGFACAAGLFCDYAAGTGCKGIADGSGECAETPTACTRDLMPVCGCDRKTYDNACGAHSEGIAVMHDGKCTADD